MRNYIKSECYRTVRSRSFYTAMLLLAGAVVFLNIVLAVSGHYIPDFRYATFRFSLNTFTAVPYSMIVLAAVIPGTIFLEDRRYGVMKTTISYGISREKLFVGKCIVAFLFTFLLLITTVCAYVGSACLLLGPPEWLPLREMLTAIVSLLPCAFGSLILMMLLGSVFPKELTAALWWVLIYYLIPLAFALLGLKIDLFARMAAWMPYNFLNSEAIVTFSSYDCLWDTAAGFAKCLTSGAVSIAVFFLIGLHIFKRQDF